MVRESCHDCQKWWEKARMVGWAVPPTSQMQLKSWSSSPLSQSNPNMSKMKGTIIFFFFFDIFQWEIENWQNSHGCVETKSNEMSNVQSSAKQGEVKKGKSYGKKGWMVKWLEIVWWWQVEVYVCVLSSPTALLIPLSFIFHSSGQRHVSLTDQTRCQGKNRMGHCWWRRTVDCEVLTEWWPVSACVCQCSRKCASQRATVTPLLLHYSQFTTKHPHKSVWSYLWGDSQMSMGFHPHYTDLKTFNGTFKTTNGF